MGRSSKLYTERHHLVPRLLQRRPFFVTNSLRTHFRPHVPLPELQDLEDPNARLEAQPIEDVQAHNVRYADLSDIDPDFIE